MKIKLKLALGLGLLFSLIAVLTSISILFINRLSDDSKNILVANYNTLDYTRNMSNALNEGIWKQAQEEEFEINLKKQLNNISEIGEKEITDKLASDFVILKKNTSDTVLLKTIRNDISEINLLNMQAIVRKSKVAENTANISILWISAVGVISFLIAFTLFTNLPSNIGNPIKELTQSIKEIAAENYSQRVHFDSHNEFGDLAKSFNTMAKKLEEYKAGNLEKLLMEKKRTETLINNMQEPVIGLDNLNNIIFINENALKIAGLKLEETLGKPIQDIAVCNDLIRILIQEMFSNDPEKINKQPLKIFADNKESYFEKELIPIKITPTGEEQEIQIGNVIILQNITAYKELDFAKTNFIGSVSHEFKTPISAMKISLQLLLNQNIGNLNPEQKKLLESIEDDSNRLLKITGELLNMTQVDSGNIQLIKKPTDPVGLIEKAIESTLTYSELKGIKLEADLVTNIKHINVDEEKTLWVFTNLISNAIHHSYENEKVTLKLYDKDGKVYFEVKDRGKGIEPQYKSKIFERYFKIPGTRNGGTGLGLAICKEFIENQGGEIEVESELGQGSRFIVSFKALDF